MSSVNSELTTAIREVMYHTQDMTPTDALQKVAEDRGLTSEKTQRVAEAVNNLRVLHMYKTSSDKAQDIELADASVAIKKAHLKDESPSELRKVASIRQLDTMYSTGTDDFYLDARSAELRAPLFDQMLKQADLHDSSVEHAPDYKFVSAIPKLAKKYAVLQKYAQDAEIEKQNTRDVFELSLLKAAQDLKRTVDFDFSTFEKDAYRIYGPVVRPILQALAATNAWTMLDRGEKVAYSLVNDRSSEHKILQNLIEKFAEYTQAFQTAREATRANKIYEAAVVGQLKKAALADVLEMAQPQFEVNQRHKYWSDKLKPTYMEDVTREDPVSHNMLTQKEHTPAKRLEMESAIAKQLGHEKDRFGELRKFPKPDKGGGKSEPFHIDWPERKPGGPGLLDMLEGAGKSMKSLGDMIGPQKKPALNAAKIRGIAQYAIQDDPILKSRNPHAITQAYKTMITVSPTLAQDPNAAISFLRHATMGDTVSYVALKDLADTEKSMMDQKKSEKK